MRRIALAGVLIAVMAGCGGQVTTVTDGGSTQAAAAASSTTSAARPLPRPVTSRVEKSVLPISCFNSSPGFDFAGTGFRVTTGVVTAWHVLATCSPATSFQVGAGTGTVSTKNPTHDLAFVTYQSPELPENSPNPDPKPLQPESRPAYVGEPLALLGIPARGPLLGDPFTLQVTVSQGIVVATNHAQVLTSADRGPETLTDAIEVACLGVSAGESGGPAIDRAGKVVGVIEGGTGSGTTTLTPVTDLTSLH